MGYTGGDPTDLIPDGWERITDDAVREMADAVGCRGDCWRSCDRAGRWPVSRTLCPVG